MGIGYYPIIQAEKIAERRAKEHPALRKTLFSKNNLIALVIFSILFGRAIKMSGEKGKPVQDFLESATTIL